MKSRVSAATLLVACAALTGCGPKTEEAAPAATTSEAAPAQAPATSSAPRVSVESAQVLGSGLFRTGAAQANVVEASRSGGILTVRVRFVRTQGAEDNIFHTVYSKPGDLEETAYLVAGDQKYFLLTDAEGDPLTTPALQLQIDRDKPLAGVWWGKFPAPPPEIREVSLTMPEVEEIGPIPISDR